MVGAIEKSVYRCGKCKEEYDFRSDAEICCMKKVKDWESVMEFELKQIHLYLLKNMYVDWSDIEFGAPMIDPKRPYGNSDVIDDIAKIIKLKKLGNWDFAEEMWNQKAEDYMEDLHRQMQVVLQIVLTCQTFELGKYKRENDYEDNWVKVK